VGEDRRAQQRRVDRDVALPEDIEAGMLDADTRRELRSLSKPTAETVARHLVAAGQLLDSDPEAALRHARAARASAARVGAVREAAGVAAYRAGQWTEALSELRTARRMTGRVDLLPVLADCERALGRPDRALALAEDPAVAGLGEAGQVEMRIVASGARRDLGQAAAAVVALQGADLNRSSVALWTARLYYAYADALLDAGRRDEALEWFTAAAGVDDDGETVADDRLAELLEPPAPSQDDPQPDTT